MIRKIKLVFFKRNSNENYAQYDQNSNVDDGRNFFESSNYAEKSNNDDLVASKVDNLQYWDSRV